MRHFALYTLVVLALGTILLAQAAPLAIPNGTIIEANMVRRIDSNKAKAGDQIEAEITWPVQAASGAVLIPKGARLLGHITTASGPTLGLVFNSIRLPDGSQASVDVIIQGAKAKLRTADVTYYDPARDNSLSSVPELGKTGNLYKVPVPIERVTLEQRESETLLRTNGQSVRLPKRAKLTLLVGPVEGVCRTKGILPSSQVSPSRCQTPEFAAAAKNRLTVVVDNHRVIGCAQSADSWVDIWDCTK